MTTFHSLTVAKVEPETRDAVTITFAIPDALRNAYAFRPGQHLTLKARLGGEELRRCYSICRSRSPGEISVAVKAIDGGRFSRYAQSDIQQGMALDVMVPGYGSSAGKALGDRILAYVLANAQKFDLNHVIWRQAIYFPDGTAHRMPDYGGPDANHYTHVHISTNGGGYPTGNEAYVMSASGPTLVKGAPTPTVTFVSAH